MGLGVIGFGMASNFGKRLEVDTTLHVYGVVLATSQRLVDEFGSLSKIRIASSPVDLIDKCLYTSQPSQR